MGAGPPALEPVVAWLFGEFGLDASAYSSSSLHRRTAACLRELKVPTGPAARAVLDARPALKRRALNALLVGVSGFFRDEAVFAALGQRILPELAAGRPGLRVYCAGVSDGQELYSVAMLLAEAGLLDGSHLVGLDCRPDALAHARDRHYGPEIAATVSPERLARHFRPTPAGFVVDPALERRVEWRLGHVGTPLGGLPHDLILFRNVGIYFRLPEVVHTWRVLYDQLAPGGVLVTGRAERPPERLGLLAVGPCAWRRAP